MVSQYSINFLNCLSFTAVSTPEVTETPFLLMQVGFTSTLAASAIPVLKLENVIRANVTSTIQADLVYTSNNTEHQLSMQVLLVLLRTNCTTSAGWEMQKQAPNC
jgi:hypothetical protein